MLRIVYIILWVCFATSAQAQMLAGKVVADCAVGFPTAVGVNQHLPLAVDIHGILCTNATGGGGGGAITAPLGTATAASAGVSVSPAASTTWPVSGTFWQATQPVSGTLAATQSGVWTVQPGNTANTTPWLATINQGGNSATVSAGGALKVDGSAATQPVSAASLPLPAGAATAANQSPGLAQGSLTSGQLLQLWGCAVTTAAPTYTTGNTNPCSLTPGGLLRVAVEAGGGTGGTSSTIGAAYPATATAIGVKDSAGTNMTFLKANASNGLVVDGSGVTQPVSIQSGAIPGRATGEAVTGATQLPVGGLDPSGNFFPLRQSIARVHTATTAYSLVLKASAGHLVDASVMCTVPGYLFIVDAAANPANGTVDPVVVPIPIQANIPSSISFANAMVPVASGAVAFVSTTFQVGGVFTKTAPSSGTCWIGGGAL